VRSSASKITGLPLKIATESSKAERKTSGGKPLRKSELADVDGDHQHMNGNRRYEGLGVEAASPALSGWLSVRHEHTRIAFNWIQLLTGSPTSDLSKRP
jgi:hypothetical protein